MTKRVKLAGQDTSGDERAMTIDESQNLNVNLGTLIAGERLPLDILATEQQFSYANISTAVGTAVKSAAGFLHGITINNAGTAWEIDVYDGTASSATRVATIRSAAVPTELLFNIVMSSGIFIDTVKGTTAGDITVRYR